MGYEIFNHTVKISSSKLFNSLDTPVNTSELSEENAQYAERNIRLLYASLF